VLTAIRVGSTIDALGFRRERHMDRNLKTPEEMERRFKDYPDAIQASADIAAQCTFDLGEIRYQYPYEQVMAGRSAQDALVALTEEAATAMFPRGLPAPYRSQIDHELRLIDSLGYAPYFLTVHSIVAEARRRGILCQGRGSAANSCVCYMLGITSIDPIQHELLFERFSGERKEPPDIDVDFEHERREEIIQWIYETYGRHRSALTAVVTRYRTRGAVPRSARRWACRAISPRCSPAWSGAGRSTASPTSRSRASTSMPMTIACGSASISPAS
jgi:error-prone DNA polymerase